MSASGIGSSASASSISSLREVVERLEHLLAPQRRLRRRGRRGCRLVDDLAALLAVGEREQLHRDQVDDAAERIGDVRRAQADGNLQRRPGRRRGGRGSPRRALSKSAPFAVELVDERQPRHVVLVGLPPDGFALGLDPFAGVEHDDRAVEHAQAALDLGREIDVARRVDAG